MVAGLNLRGKVYNYIYSYGDDNIGGALPSGTVSYQQIDLRIQAIKPTYALLQQGVESVDTYVALVHPHTTIIENNNEIEIIAPANSLYYGEHFRVRGNAQRTSTGSSDSRGYLLVSLQRIEKSRSIQ